MVRTYKRKTERGTQYSKEDLSTALAEIKAGRLTGYRAHKVYNIPLQTIYSHLSGRRGKKSCSQGRSTVFTADQERAMASGLMEMEKCGFGLSRDEILNLVKEYVESNGIKTPFKDNRPNADWLRGFMARNRLSLKKPQSVEVARRNCLDPFIIYGYYDLLESTIDTLGLRDKPHLIFNLDETSFCRDPSKTKVVGGKGLPSTRTTSSAGRENISVLFMVSASGEKLPPLIIFKGMFIWSNWQPNPEEVYDGLTYAATKNGWMETDVFENFIERTFVPFLKGERPALIVCDGHKTHVSLKLIELARMEGITILILPPHSSHILQPLDISVMKPLKTAWDKELVLWQKHHIGTNLPKAEFVKILSVLWKDLDPSVVKSGFEKAGIVPFDRNVISPGLFDPLALERFNNSINENSNAEKQMSQDDAFDGTRLDLPETSVSLENPDPEIQNETPDEPAAFPAISSLDSRASQLQPGTSTATPDQPPQATIAPKPFNQLLLETISAHKSGTTAIKKRSKIGNGSEVITTDESYQRVMDLKIRKEEEIRRKEEMKIARAEKTKLKENTKKIKEPKKKKKKLEVLDDSSDDSEEQFGSQNSEDEMEDWDSYMQRMDEETEEQETGEFKKVEDLAVDDWVLARFTGKRTTKHFVGQVVRFEHGDPLIRFLRKHSSFVGGTTFNYPVQEDISSVETQDIVSILPPPKMGRRGDATFDVKFEGFTVC